MNEIMRQLSDSVRDLGFDPSNPAEAALGIVGLGIFCWILMHLIFD